MIFNWPSFPIDLVSFNTFLKANIPDADGIFATPDNFTVVEKNPLTPDEQNAVNNYYNSLTQAGEAAKIAARTNFNPYNSAIINAMIFGFKLMVQFAATNVQNGITQAGKTAAVATYLQDVQGYLSTGSLYEAINTLTNLRSAGAPSDLSPFITNDVLTSYLNQIQTFLGVPLT